MKPTNSAQRIACVIEGYNEGIVYGRAWTSDSATAPVLDLFDAGVKVATFTADQPRPDVPSPGPDDARCGFQVAVPHKLFDGQRHTLSICTSEATDDVLASAEVQLPRAAGKTRERPVEGHADTVRGLFAQGWAFDPEEPAARVEVELLAEGRVVASGIADRFRPDLAKAGKGDGHCMFSVRIPPALMDGRPVELTVRECRTGSLLRGPLALSGAAQAKGAVHGLEGGYVAGWVHDPSLHGAAPEVELWIDGELAARAAASEPRKEGEGHAWRIRLPERFLDGRPHEIAVSAAAQPGVLGTIAAMTPLSTTPIDALQRHAGTAYMKGYLSPIGPLRYESLRRSLDELKRRALESPAEDVVKQVQALVNAHEALLRGPVVRAECEPLAFPVHDKPQVSVVIPAHDKFGYTYCCLASIVAAQNRATYEIILVDDGSTDRTARIEELVSGITVVRHASARGFVHACNAGADKARGEYIVLLNNDTEVMSGWLDELLEPFQRFQAVGLTGAKLLYPDGRLQEAGGIVWSRGEAWNNGRDGNPRDPRFCYTRQVDYVSGACIMLPAALWKALKGFDEQFAPGYYEDTDLAFRVRAAGYKTLYTPFCEVVHHEGVTSGTSTSGSGMKRFQAINESKFRTRWAASCAAHGLLGRDAPHMVQDRNVLMRALVFDAQTLTPDKDAGSYAAMQEIRLLQSLGFKVTFVPANLSYLGGYTEALQRMGVEVLYAPFVTGLAEVLERRGGEFHLVYIARYAVAESVIDTVRARAPHAKVVLNIHDLHFLREIREAIRQRDPALLQRAAATREAELAVMRKVDLVVSYSLVEHAVIESHNMDGTRLALNPWVVDTAERVPAFDERKDIAFLGGFAHRPNAEGVEWFVKEVMPLLRARLPGVRFLVYGSNLPESLEALAADDVVFKGFVKSTEEVYDSARVFVAPLLSGAGLKGKVIGAFARGIPTVMTPVAAEGTGASNGLHAVIASRPEDWAGSIATLYSDRGVWQAMSERSMALTREANSFARGQEMLLQALQSAGVFPTSDNQALGSRFPVK